MMSVDPPGGNSTCNIEDGCSAAWPPLYAQDNEAPIGEWTIVVRENGAKTYFTSDVAYIRNKLQNKEKIMGFGHAVYKDGDPRAKHLREMSRLASPVIVICIGEGGSGGALAIAVGDRILILENSVYSVISPEGCASITWRDATKATTAAEALKMTAEDLLKEIRKEAAELGIVPSELPTLKVEGANGKMKH